MPLNIGDKTYRNMQEQVAYNSEQIKKIFETLDGLNVQDNVIVVPDMSYILSQEELEIVNKEVAFIVYNNQLYIKKTQSASSAYFDIVFTITSGAAITFNSKEIEVTLSNGALGLTTLTESTYSTTQIDNKVSPKADKTYVDAQLALKADLAGADFTGAVTAPTFEQSQANWSANVSVTPSITNGIFALIYGRFEVINNVLYYVFLYKITASGGNVASGNFSNSFSFPAEIASKIYDVNGATVGENGGNANIVGFEALYRNSAIGAPQNALRAGMNNANGNNAVSFYHPYPAITEGDTMFIQERVFLTLI